MKFPDWTQMTGEEGTYRTSSELKCPKCGALLDAATRVGGVKDETPTPVKNDISVCLKCAAFLEFTDSGYELLGKDKLHLIAATHPDGFRDLMKAYVVVKMMIAGYRPEGLKEDS